MTKQVFQDLRQGETQLVEVPVPPVPRAGVLIQTRATLISAGTERMLVEFGKAGFLGKAKAQPEKVKQVIDKIRTDGLLPTLEAVFNKLDEPLPLGYCNAGVVIGAQSGKGEGRGAEGGGRRTEDGGQGAKGQGQGGKGEAGRAEDGGRRAEGGGQGVWGREFGPGDRVVSNGPHAEIVAVPRNLCAKIPDGVTDEQAAFTVLASIGLQGIRLLEPTLGERVVVYGLGLIGLITVQLLRAHGCDVLGVDINPQRLELAKRFGARVVNPAAGGDPVAAAGAWTNGVGVDGVLIAASAKTDDIVHQAAQMCRKRGRIVLVGVVGLNLRRADFYEKELTFQVSCSYGPGRYDEKYEQGGQDYPIAFVRWTEQRNFEAVLAMMASGRLNVDPLITHRFAFADAAAAYQTVSSDPSALGVVLTYPAEVSRAPALVLRDRSAVASARAVLGVIGAGNYSKMTLMPALSKTPGRIKFVCDLNGAAAAHLARKFGAEQAVTEYQAVLKDPEVNGVFVVVGHSLHARFVCEALQAGKHVFVEKPLAMNVDEVRQVLQAVGQSAKGEAASAGREAASAGGEAVSAEREAGSAEREAVSAGREEASAEWQGQRAEGDLAEAATPAHPSPFPPTASPLPPTASPLPPTASPFPPAASPLPLAPSPLLMVGFNRRFSPHTVRMKEVLRGRSEPLAMNMTVNAGIVPPEHWVHDPVRGGGRIIGEACHFIDLMVFLTGSPVRTVAATMMGQGTAVKEDKMSISLGFEDGSVGTVNYFANGSKSYPKELLEVFSEGRVLRLDNFRRLEGCAFRNFRRFKTWRQDKGHAAEFGAFVDRIERGGEPLIPLAEIVNVTLASFAAMTSAREERTVVLQQEYAGL